MHTVVIGWLYRDLDKTDPCLQYLVSTKAGLLNCGSVADHFNREMWNKNIFSPARLEGFLLGATFKNLE